MSRNTAASNDILDIIRQVVLEEAEKLNIRVDKIILFGSRARGESREDSDYDILIVVKETLNRGTRRHLATMIMKRMYEEAGVDADIIITTRENWMKYSGTPGTIYYPARREGLVIEQY